MDNVGLVGKLKRLFREQAMQTRVIKYLIRSDHPDFPVLRSHCLESRRLYNALNSVAREKENFHRNGVVDTPRADGFGVRSWLENDHYIGSKYAFEPIRKSIEAHQEVRLPQKVAQAVGVKLSNAWKSCIELRRKGVFARSPSYKRIYGLVEYNIQAISKRGLTRGFIIPSGWKTGVELSEHVGKVRSARLYHSHKSVFVLEVLHLVDDPVASQGDVMAAIDLGVNKLATVVFSDGSYPLSVKGEEVKSVNQGANRLASLKSTKNKCAMWKKRTRRVNHYLHSSSSAIVRLLLERGVNKLVIGWNEGFKDSPKMGRKNNQRFTSLPLARFRDMLTYKAEQVGIKVIIQEESYTSKASFIDSDEIPVYEKGSEVKHQFSGRRVKRGVYKSKAGTLIHADVNGAYNTLRKSNPLFEWSSGFVVKPRNLAFAY